jgi:N4-(beta-N-acetylglucosaminyl)-L-asparaginase
MTDRRSLIKASLLAPALLARSASAATGPAGIQMKIPCVVSTWPFGVAANKTAWTVLSKGGRALDAVEKGVMVPEADLKNHTVGRGGYPDRDGHVTLDASIMDEHGNCGAVAGMEHIAHAIPVARAVMEKTPHVMLVGEGATQFAVEQGFKKEELLTPESRAAWEKWRKTAKYQPVSNIEVKSYGQGTNLGTPGGAGNHDTIGMLAIDAHGNLSGACTTSGAAWKMHGRVGDSPIIGAGLYVDNDVGGATSTGMGEEVIRNVGSFLVVELMRGGMGPQDACKAAVERILKRKPETKMLQVGFLAINKKGEVGAWAIQKGFSYSLCDQTSQDRVVPGQAFYEATPGN